MKGVLDRAIALDATEENLRMTCCMQPAMRN